MLIWCSINIIIIFKVENSCALSSFNSFIHSFISIIKVKQNFTSLSLKNKKVTYLKMYFHCINIYIVCVRESCVYHDKLTKHTTTTLLWLSLVSNVFITRILALFPCSSLLLFLHCYTYEKYSKTFSCVGEAVMGFFKEHGWISFWERPGTHSHIYFKSLYYHS